MRLGQNMLEYNIRNRDSHVHLEKRVKKIKEQTS